MIPAFSQYNFDSLSGPAQVVLQEFKAHRGVRIGQSTVLSRKVHTVNPNQPEVVTIVQNSDAGRVFYQRTQPDQIVHFDIFHECGYLDHHQVAKTLVLAIKQYNFHKSVQNGIFQRNRSEVSANYFDVQTGTGGGRITGSLNFGQKRSLRLAHTNHVHIAGVLAETDLICIFYIVQAVERVILTAGLELRANEGLCHTVNNGGGTADLTPYSDQSDSFLQDKNGANTNNGGTQSASHQQLLQDAAELAEVADSAYDAKRLLNQIKQQADHKTLQRLSANKDHYQQLCEELAGRGVVSCEANRLRLTDYGEQLQEYLDKRLPEVESYIKCLYRLAKPYVVRPGRTKANGSERAFGSGRRLLSNNIVDGELAIAETVQSAASRLAQTPGTTLRISPEDIRRNGRQAKRHTEICILLDTSASMIGSRLNAAKYLIRHLLLSTPDKISVVLFNEDHATVKVPFTRDFSLVQQSLKGLNPIGATPLGVGLRTCSEYLATIRLKQPLILLITDGVPTFADNGSDPLVDALEAARAIKQRGYGFVCLGLQPDRDFLTQLAQAAGGSVYILKELERQALITAAWQDNRIGAQY